MIRSQGRERICMVVTFKNCDASESRREGVFRPPIRILDGKDGFEDGEYELVLGEQIFPLTKIGGNYLEIVEAMVVQ